MNQYKKYIQAIFLSIALLLGLSISQASNLSIEIMLGDDIHHIKRNPVYNLVAVSTPLTVEIYDFDFNQIAVLGRDNRTEKSDTSIAWKPDGLQIAVDNDAEIVIWIFDPLAEKFQQNVIVSPSASAFRGVSGIDWGDQLAVMYTYQPFGLNVEVGQIDIIDDETWTLVSSSIETDGSSFSLIQPMYMLEISPANNEVLSGINYCPSWPMECSFPTAFIAHTSSLEVSWFQDDTSWIEDIGWSPNGGMFALSGSKVFIYEANTKQLIWEWSESKYYPVFIEWNHENDQILAVNERGEAWLLDIASQQAVRILDVPGFVKTITWDSANDRLYIGTVDKRLVVQCVICSELSLSTSTPTETAVPTPTDTPAPTDTPTTSPSAMPFILDVSWSPDGEMLATVDNSGKLEIMLPDQAATVFEFTRTVPELVEAAVVWSPLGDRFAAGIGNRMYIWDATSWQLLYDYEVGLPSGFFTWGNIDNIPEGVQTITWSMDERYVVVGTYSYETSVWDTQEGQVIFRDGDLSGGGPGRVWLGDGWLGDGANKLNAFTGEIVRPSSTDRQQRYGATAEGGTTEQRPDNTQIAWGTDSGFLVIYDLNTLWGIQAFDITQTSTAGFRRGIADISWDGTWNFIAVVSHDGELYVANLLTEEVATVLNIDGRLNAVDSNPISNEIVYAGVSSTGEPILEIVDVTGIAGVPSLPSTATDTPMATPAHMATLNPVMLTELKYSPNGEYIAGGGFNTLKIWNSANGALVFDITPYINESDVIDLTWSPDNTRLAVAFGDQFVRIWNVTNILGGSGTPVAEFEPFAGSANLLTSIDWHSNEELLAIAGFNRQPKIQFWDTNSYTLISRSGGRLDISQLSWKPFSDMLAALSYESGTPFFMPMGSNQNGYAICPSGCESEYASSLAWNGDGTQLALGYADGEVYIVDSATNQEILSFYGQGYITRLAWRSDNKLLAIASTGNNPIKLWDISSGQVFETEAVSIVLDFSPVTSDLAFYDNLAGILIIEDTSNYTDAMPTPIPVLPSPSATP